MSYSRFSKPPAHHQEDLTVFLRGSGIIILGMVSKVFLVFATEVIAARILLPERYGLITWGLFMVNIMCMLTGLGLNTATRRFLPVYQSENDSGAVRGTVILSSTLSVIGGILGSVLLFVVAGWLATNVMEDERQTPILLTFVFVLPLWNLQKTMLAVMGGFKLPMHKILIEDLLAPAGFLLVVLLAWAMNWKEIPIARGYVLVFLLSALLSMVVVYTRTPFRETRHVRPQYRTREILGFSWPLIFTEPLGKTTGHIDILIIGALAATYDVGIYRAASDMAVIMPVILLCFGFMYLPMVSEFIAQKDYTQWRDMNARVARWSMLVCFPFFATFFFLPSEVIHTVYGPEYIGAAPILRILAVAYFGHAMVGFTGMNLAAAGMTKAQLMAHLTSFTINIGGNFLLIPIYGIQGAAVASLLSLWTLNCICLVVMKWRLGLQPFTRLYAYSLGGLLLIASGGSFLLRLVNFFPDVILVMLFLLLCFGFIGLLCFWGHLIDATDRVLIQSLINQYFRKEEKA